MLRIGTVIDGKYKILNIIGRGGMSTVYLAINEKANKPWAIKEVRKDADAGFEVVYQSLISEKEILKKLSHKGLPSIIDVIDDSDNFLIVMDYIEGITLKTVLKEQGPQPQTLVTDWALQLCETLKYLHDMTPPIIYRDLKPSNIMLRPDGSLVIIDFGTAREYKDKNKSDTTYLGTKGYAAPEQFGGLGQTDARTDIYNLGAVMYHLVTGHDPSEPPYEIYPITKWDTALSDGLEHIICKCTQPDPQKRFQSARELIYVLEHYKDLEHKAITGYRKKLNKFAINALFAMMAAALSLATGFKAYSKQRNEYEYLVEVADRSTDFDIKTEYYLKAVNTDPVRYEAYQKLVESFENDGIFSDEEEKILIKTDISVNGFLDKFEEGDPEKYADFCYEIGNLYWFYYEHEESRQLNSVKWFKTASDYYEDNETKYIEWKRSRLYAEMGGFYKDIVLRQKGAKDKGIYLNYWSDLLELKKLNDTDPDKDMITLRLYNEIIGRTMEYAGVLFEQGVTKKEVNRLYEDIRTDINEMELQEESVIYKEREKTQKLLEMAKEMTNATAYGIKKEY